MMTKSYNVDTSRLYAMFDAAVNQSIRKPVIRLTVHGIPIKLRVHRATNRIYINGEQYGVTYGWLTTGNRVTFEANAPTDLDKLIALLCRDPQRVVAAYGHTQHNCSFCGRDLSDPRSESVGYGPICAGYYDLPWGEIAS